MATVKTATPARIAPKLGSIYQWRKAATLAMGVFIPLFSLGLSNVGGERLMAGGAINAALGALAFGLMACVLGVSLPHLAWGVGNITRSPALPSWLLAVAFDLTIVLGELCHVVAPSQGPGWVIVALTVAVVLLSMFLNCWAFFYAPAHEARETGKVAKGKATSPALAA